MGRPPRPNRLRVVHDQEPIPRPTFERLRGAKPPAELPRAGKAEWRRMLGLIERHPNLASVVDRPALIAHCQQWAVFLEATADIAKRGVLVPGRSSADAARDGGPALVKNPSVQIARDAQAQIRAWCVQFGFTPLARGRLEIAPITLPDVDEDEEDTFDWGI